MEGGRSTVRDWRMGVALQSNRLTGKLFFWGGRDGRLVERGSGCGHASSMGERHGWGEACVCVCVASPRDGIAFIVEPVVFAIAERAFEDAN